MTYDFKFDAPVLQLIFAGLAKLPFEQSASLIQGLQREVQAQDAAKANADETAKTIDTETVKERKKPGRKPKPPANGAAEQPQA